jgi:hypothetical protein
MGARCRRDSLENAMNGTRILGLAAVAAAFVLSAPVERAAALSLSNPAAAPAVQDTAKATTEVAWHHHHHWHHGHGRHRGWHHRHWHHRHWHHRHWR